MKKTAILIFSILIFTFYLQAQTDGSMKTPDSSTDTSITVGTKDTITAANPFQPVKKAEKQIGPIALTVLGMTTVFVGLLIMQLFINLLKLFLNPPPKVKEKSKEEEYNKAILNSVELTEDETVATVTAILMESKLHHSVSNDKLTLKWADREPNWLKTRRI